jgi:DNA-binding MarR family transcriptional regulator
MVAQKAVSGRNMLPRLVGFQLHLATMRTGQAARAALAEMATTPAKVTAMLYVLDHPGCDQTTLGRFLNIGRSAVMKLLNTMESRGHVERREGRDLRSNGLHVTPAGEDFLARALDVLERSDREATAALTPAEQEQLLHLLHKLQADHIRSPETPDTGLLAYP